MDVIRAGDGWLATCDCGLAHAATTEPNAWLWLANHECVAPVIPSQPTALETATAADE